MALLTKTWRFHYMIKCQRCNNYMGIYLIPVIYFNDNVFNKLSHMILHFSTYFVYNKVMKLNKLFDWGWSYDTKSI